MVIPEAQPAIHERQSGECDDGIVYDLNAQRHCLRRFTVWIWVVIREFRRPYSRGSIRKTHRFPDVIRLTTCQGIHGGKTPLGGHWGRRPIRNLAKGHIPSTPLLYYQSFRNRQLESGLWRCHSKFAAQPPGEAFDEWDIHPAMVRLLGQDPHGKVSGTDLPDLHPDQSIITQECSSQLHIGRNWVFGRNFSDPVHMPLPSVSQPRVGPFTTNCVDIAWLDAQFVPGTL